MINTVTKLPADQSGNRYSTTMRPVSRRLTHYLVSDAQLSGTPRLYLDPDNLVNRLEVTRLNLRGGDLLKGFNRLWLNPTILLIALLFHCVLLFTHLLNAVVYLKSCISDDV